MEKKSSEVRKEEIIQSAWDLIMSEGARGLTIKNISRRIPISEAAIYRHFENKHSILMALAEDFEYKLLHAIDKPIKNYKNPITRLKEIMKTHIIFTEEKKRIFFAITAESIHFHDDVLRRKILEVINNYKEKIKIILLEAKRQGMIKEDMNINMVSLLFFGIIQAAIIQYSLTNYTVPPITKFNSFWKVFLNGILLKENTKS